MDVRIVLPLRFWKRIDKDGDLPANCPERGRCWIWYGAHDKDGYPIFSNKLAPGITQKAHRLTFLEKNGWLPDGPLDHLCRNQPCPNPEHVEPVTSLENLVRSPFAPAARNLLKTHCPRGHAYAGKNLAIRRGRKGQDWRICHTCERARQREAKRVKRGYYEKAPRSAL